jgi:hypothetical protein
MVELGLNTSDLNFLFHLMFFVIWSMDWSVKKGGVFGLQENLLVMLEFWISWGVVNNDGSNFDIIIDTVFGVLNKIL